MPVASTMATSPSWRVWDGCTARAMPWWALCARSQQSPLEQRASVATTTSVGLGSSGPANGVGSGNGSASGGAWEPASMVPAASWTSPMAFTTARAPTVASPTVALAEPKPPGTACSAPRHFPTVAPVPAPTRPVAVGAVAAASAAARPSRAPGRVPPDATRS